MRRCDLVTGILLILSTINFVVTAPVFLQEKHQARVDVVDIPKDATTVLEKRWDEEVEKLGEEFFKTPGTAKDSSGTHTSSSPVSPGPDYGSTDIIQSPAPDQGSSTTNPDPSMEPCCSLSSRSMQGLLARGGVLGKCQKCLGLMDAMADATFDLPTWMYYSPKLPEYSSYSKFPAMKPWIDPAADPDFDWHYWLNTEDPPPPPTPPTPPRPALPKDEGQTSGHGPGPQPTGSELSPWKGPPRTEFYSVTVGPSPFPEAGWPTGPEHEVVAEPPPSPDSELHSDHQSSSAGSQPEDFQAAIYAAKGKEKESRGISSTVKDVGDAAQSELQPIKRSLNPARKV